MYDFNSVKFVEIELSKQFFVRNITMKQHVCIYMHSNRYRNVIGVSFERNSMREMHTLWKEQIETYRRKIREDNSQSFCKREE